MNTVATEQYLEDWRRTTSSVHRGKAVLWRGHVMHLSLSWYDCCLKYLPRSHKSYGYLYYRSIITQNRTIKATHGSDLSSTKRACLKSLNFSWKSTCSVTSWFFSISNPLCGCTAAMFLVLLVSGIKTSKNIGKIKSTLMDEVEDTHAVPHVIPTSANISIASNRNLLPCSALG